MTESQSDQSLSDQSLELVAKQAEAIGQIQRSLKDIYFVSGLGADARVFRLLKIEGYQPVYIHWLDPERGESIEHYAQRLTQQIKSERPIIVSLSFGGMIAVEIAKQIEVEKVIIISSAKDKFEIPLYFKMFRWLPIHRVFPFKSLLWAGYPLIDWFFSLESSDERQLLKAILLDTDANFVRWAFDKVITWNNELIPDRLHHIHGKGDRIFPIRFVEANVVIPKSGHFMIMNRAAEISELLKKMMS
jgi:pimeloyl-ACP methyl ester carboxylesterase